MRPILVDFYCCAGGASRGYDDAGFDVYGVDHDPQPNYPYPFHQGDARHVMAMFEAGLAVPFTMPGGQTTWLTIDDVDAFAGSPPCQTHSALTKGNRKRKAWADGHVDLIPATREFFERAGRPYVIENVQGSPLRRDLTLCGLKHFGLRVFRHRYFELGGWSMPPQSCNGQGDHAGHRVAGWRHKVRYEGDMVAVYGDGGGKGSIADWESAMGIDWVTVGTPMERKKTIAQAIPPAYTRHIGAALIAHLADEVAA